MTEMQLARIARSFPYIALGCFVGAVLSGMYYGSPAWFVGLSAAAAGITSVCISYIEGILAVQRRRMVVWEDAPPGESGPRVSIPWHVARALQGHEWVTLPHPRSFDGKAIDTGWPLIAAWITTNREGYAPMWCNVCGKLKLGHDPGNMEHASDCTRGRALETLRVCMEQAVDRANRGVDTP